MSGPAVRNASWETSAATARLEEYLMQWFLYFVMFWLGFGALSTIAMVGKPRQSITSGTAVATVLISAAIIVGLAVVQMRVANG